MKYLRYALWALVTLLVLTLLAYRLSQIILPQSADTPAVITPLAGFNKGTPFTLTDHNGAAFDSTKAIKAGEYALIFFGFTHCPVICPTELQKMASVMDLLSPEAAAKLHPLFITIDPERDTVDTMQKYVPQFHPSIVGLTGKTWDVHAVLNAWKVYYSKVEDPQLSDYTMDHSTYAYLVDHDMTILAVFPMKATAKDLAKTITDIVR